MDKPAIKSTTYEPPEFAAFIAGIDAHFAVWRRKSAKTLRLSMRWSIFPRRLITLNSSP
jgi:hypothetical protein